MLALVSFSSFLNVAVSKIKKLQNAKSCKASSVVMCLLGFVSVPFFFS